MKLSRMMNHGRSRRLYQNFTLRKPQAVGKNTGQTDRKSRKYNEKLEGWIIPRKHFVPGSDVFRIGYRAKNGRRNHRHCIDAEFFTLADMNRDWKDIVPVFLFASAFTLTSLTVSLAWWYCRSMKAAFDLNPSTSDQSFLTRQQERYAMIWHSKLSDYRKWKKKRESTLQGGSRLMDAIFAAFVVSNMTVFFASKMMKSQYGCQLMVGLWGYSGFYLTRRTRWAATVTHVFNHSSGFHLSTNLLYLLCFGPPSMYLLGPEQCTAVFLSGSVWGAVASMVHELLTGRRIYIQGMSAGVYTILFYGAAKAPMAPIISVINPLFLLSSTRAYSSFSADDENHPRQLIVNITIGFVALHAILINLYMAKTAVKPTAAHAAHIGGALFGFTYAAVGGDCYYERAKKWIREDSCTAMVPENVNQQELKNSIAVQTDK